MSTELNASSPARHECQIRPQVTMDTATTPGIVVKLPTNMPDPSPNKSAAAMALSLLGQKNNSNIAPPSPPPPTTSPEEGSVSLSAAKRPVPPPMPHPLYAAWQQYHYPDHPDQSPYPTKKLKVSHAEVAKQMTPSYHGMHPPPYVPSPYAAYPPQQGVASYAPRKNGMPAALYGQALALYHHAPYPSPSGPPVFVGKPFPPPPVGSSMVTPTPKKQNYSRKSKSLGILCENFISTFTKASDKNICIDDAAKALGVERRRIYDIINIFESLDIVQRKCKNTYEWLGTDQLPQVLSKFQQEAFHEFPEEAVANGLLQGHVTPRPPPNKGAKKSLGKLSQQFAQLFLTGHKVLSLNDASDKILGVGCGDVATLKTKIRRMYDISNVFVALGLVEKLLGESRREQPRFKWCFYLSAEQILTLFLKEQRAATTILTVTIPKVNVSQDEEEEEESQKETTNVLTVTIPTILKVEVSQDEEEEESCRDDAAAATAAPPLVTQDEGESRDDVDSVAKTDETEASLSASGTPVSDKKLMANIHAMGAAQDPELCRTVSLTADL